MAFPFFKQTPAVTQLTPPYAWRCGCPGCQVAWGLLVAANERRCSYHPDHTPVLVHWDSGQHIDVAIAQQWLIEQGFGNYTVQ